MNKSILSIGIICLFILSTVSPIVIGISVKTIDNNVQSISSHNVVSSEHVWPIFRQNPQNTGLSPFDTSGNPGFEKWKYLSDHSFFTTAVIDENDTLYIPDTWEGLHTIYPDGLKKWIGILIDGHGARNPAIGPDGTIYVSTNKLVHAFNPNGDLKWTKDFYGQLTVNTDGMIYVGTIDGLLYALYPNGTIYWTFYIGMNDLIFAPAIGHNGNIYITTRYKDNILCINPDGSLLWQSEYGNIEGVPVIGDDGTIYLSGTGDDLIVLNPDGTEKYIVDTNDLGTYPSIAPDGTIILCGNSEIVGAVDSADGSIIWTYQIKEETSGVSPVVIGADGTIYFAYEEWRDNTKGYICALTSNGNLKWKRQLTTDYYPYNSITLLTDLSIGSDGTVYVPTKFSRSGSGPTTTVGYVHAFGKPDPDSPTAPIIEGTKKRIPGNTYEYTFKSTSPIGNDLYYFINWGDENSFVWIGPFASGEELKINYSWKEFGLFKIQARCKDTENLWGDWTVYQTAKSTDKALNNNLYMNLIEHFPILKEVLLRLINL